MDTKFQISNGSIFEKKDLSKMDLNKLEVALFSMGLKFSDIDKVSLENDPIKDLAHQVSLKNDLLQYKQEIMNNSYGGRLDKANEYIKTVTTLDKIDKLIIKSKNEICEFYQINNSNSSEKTNIRKNGGLL